MVRLSFSLNFLDAQLQHAAVDLLMRPGDHLWAASHFHIHLFTRQHGAGNDLAKNITLNEIHSILSTLHPGGSLDVPLHNENAGHLWRPVWIKVGSKFGLCPFKRFVFDTLSAKYPAKRAGAIHVQYLWFTRLCINDSAWLLLLQRLEENASRRRIKAYCISLARVSIVLRLTKWSPCKVPLTTLSTVPPKAPFFMTLLSILPQKLHLQNCPRCAPSLLKTSIFFPVLQVSEAAGPGVLLLNSQTPFPRTWTRIELSGGHPKCKLKKMQFWSLLQSENWTPSRLKRRRRLDWQMRKWSTINSSPVLSSGRAGTIRKIKECVGPRVPAKVSVVIIPQRRHVCSKAWYETVPVLDSRICISSWPMLTGKCWLIYARLSTNVLIIHLICKKLSHSSTSFCNAKGTSILPLTKPNRYVISLWDGLTIWLRGNGKLYEYENWGRSFWREFWDEYASAMPLVYNASRNAELRHVWYRILDCMASPLSLGRPWIKILICTLNIMAWIGKGCTNL